MTNSRPCSLLANTLTRPDSTMNSESPTSPSLIRIELRGNVRVTPDAAMAFSVSDCSGMAGSVESGIVDCARTNGAQNAITARGTDPRPLSGRRAGLHLTRRRKSAHPCRSLADETRVAPRRSALPPAPPRPSRRRRPSTRSMPAATRSSTSGRPGVPMNYGGLVFKAGDPNTILMGGAANGGSGRFYEVAVDPRQPETTSPGSARPPCAASAPTTTAASRTAPAACCSIRSMQATTWRR